MPVRFFRYVTRWLWWLGLVVMTTHCKFTRIEQPSAVLPGQTLEVSLEVSVDIVPEPNAHHGVLCMLLPKDWSVITAEYRSPLGNGILTNSPAWADSAEACYPAARIAEEMAWVGMISDSGYTYQDPFLIDITVTLQAGLSEGCFNLGYLVTKATADLLCSGNPAWAPLSYPHPLAVSTSGIECTVLTADPAPEWNELFDRRSGWTGADGIYSIPLSGRETPGRAEEENTLILFSDTFIGEVDENHQRRNVRLVNNTMAFLQGDQPLPENIEFFWRSDSNNQPAAVFIPDTPNSKPGDWYWLMDGIALEDSVYLFALRLEPGGGGAFDFNIIGITLISFGIADNPAVDGYHQREAPLFYRSESGGWDLVLGQAVMPLTARSGVPHPDGYIYVYGPRSSSAGKELVAARVLPEDFPDFTRWRYWDGGGWSTSIEQCAAITRQISQEFSLSPLGNGQYILVSQLSSYVVVRFGESPTGPFGFINTVYFCPEVQEDPDIFVYNAKAHPHLSPPGSLLISYNVNTFDFLDHFSNADIYRPRFVTLAIDEVNPVFPSPGRPAVPATVILYQNDPNPFNPATCIRYELSEAAGVTLKIYTILGQEIRILANGRRRAGSHEVWWDGTDAAGQAVASGMYIYLLTVNGKTTARRMLLIR